MPNNGSWVTVNGGELTASSVTDVYAAMSSYWILVTENIQLLRRSYEFETFDDFLKNELSAYQEQYTDARSNTLDAFENELRRSRNQGQDYEPIHPDVFRAVRQYHNNAARKELATCLYAKLPGRDRHNSYVNKVWKALAMCILHMDKGELHNVQRTILSFGGDGQDAERKRALLNRTFKEEFHLYFEIEHLLQQDESCKLVSDLIYPFRRESSSNVKGQLKIVKVLGVADGNRLYKTVCIARKVALPREDLEYTFEVLRDYGSFHITSLNTKTTEPLFRVRRKLQPEQCEFRYSNIVLQYNLSFTTTLTLYQSRISIGVYFRPISNIYHLFSV